MASIPVGKAIEAADSAAVDHDKLQHSLGLTERCLRKVGRKLHRSARLQDAVGFRTAFQQWLMLQTARQATGGTGLQALDFAREVQKWSHGKNVPVSEGDDGIPAAVVKSLKLMEKKTG